MTTPSGGAAGALEHWLTGQHDAPATRNGVAGHTPLAAVVPRSPAGVSESPGGGELEAMAAELELIRGRAALQRDPAWLEELSPTERSAERAAAETIRGMRRDRQLAAATAAAKLGCREQRVTDRLARMELSDRTWGRRAQARRMRLLDPTSRLASLQRTHVGATTALGGVAVAGIAWTSLGVHDALVGPGGSPAAYVVEPIFSVPLLAIMGLSARAAQWGKEFPPPGRQGRIYALEAFLLAATIAMNTASVLPGAGTWHNLATLLAHLLPPVLIVIAVTLQPMVGGFLAEILITAEQQTTHRAAADSADTTVEEHEVAPVPPRLDAATTVTLTLAARVQAATGRGELVEWGDTGLPSISSIQRYLRCEKRRAQLVWDALHILTSSPADQSSAPSLTARRSS